MMKTKKQLMDELANIEVLEPTTCIKQPSDIVPMFAKYRKRKQEVFVVACLDGAHNVIGCKVVTSGILNRAIVHPREVFRSAIIKNSASVILCHNHPSGNTEPSREDKDLTERMVKAGEILGIQVLDHIIIGDGFYSFIENSLI